MVALLKEQAFETEVKQLRQETKQLLTENEDLKGLVGLIFNCYDSIRVSVLLRQLTKTLNDLGAVILVLCVKI